MSKNTIRAAIVVFALVTGVIHAVILNLQGVDWLMLLNGLGYFALTWAIFTNVGFLAKRRRLIHYLFMAYTIVTIVGFFVMNDTYGPLGIIAKVDEVLLLVALWLNLDR
jgi:hypothetical protein